MVLSGKNVVKTKSSRTGSKRRLSGDLCERLGITYPIFGFSHSVEVTAALAKAGCYPTIGLSQEMPEDIPAIVARLRDLVGDRPFGVDLLVPASITDQSDRSSMKANLPTATPRDARSAALLVSQTRPSPAQMLAAIAPQPFIPSSRPAR